MKIRLLIAVLPAVVLLNTSHATYEGTYKYLGYNVVFHSGNPPSNGETKSMSVDFSTITTSSSNTFDAVFTETQLERTIGNFYTSGPTIDCVNVYTTTLTNETDPGTGTVSPADNMVLHVYPDDQPGMEIPFYFSRNTNVALHLELTETNMLTEIGMNVLMRESNDMNSTDVIGPYSRFSLGSAAYGMTTNGWGNIDRISLDQALMVFDGIGGYTETASTWAADRITSETNIVINNDSGTRSVCTVIDESELPRITNGTYSVTPSGTLYISMSDGIVTNQISPDGNLAVSTFSANEVGYAGIYYTIAIKQPLNMPTNAIDAVYFMAEIGEGFASTSELTGFNNNAISLGRTYAFLRSDGTFDIRTDYWPIENTLNTIWSANPPGSISNRVSVNVFDTVTPDKTIEFQSGTYTIETNGAITLDFGGGDIGYAQISDNGEYIAFGYGNFGDDDVEYAMGIGILRDPPTFPAPAEFTDISMSPTGAVITISMPANEWYEGIYTDNLKDREWESGGLFYSPTGSPIIHTDFDSIYEDIRFYSATFAPW